MTPEILARRRPEHKETFTPRQMPGALQGKPIFFATGAVWLQAVEASLSCLELLSAQLCRVLPDQVQMTVPRCQV
jgi:hypothetical protein